MDIQDDKDFAALPEVAKLYQACKERDLTIAEREYLKGARDAWQAKAKEVPEGFALVSQKELLELTIAINAVDLATHTESKTNEVREMWQQVALKLMALGTTQEPK